MAQFLRFFACNPNALAARQKAGSDTMAVSARWCLGKRDIASQSLCGKGAQGYRGERCHVKVVFDFFAPNRRFCLGFFCLKSSTQPNGKLMNAPAHDSCLRHGLSDAQWSVAGPLIDWPKALAGPQETIACFSARFCGWRGPEGLGRTCRISAAGTRGNAVRQALLWQVVGRLVLVLDRPLAQRRRICAICVCASSMSDVADFEAFLATAASTSDSWRAACSAAFSRAASALERPTCPV